MQTLKISETQYHASEKTLLHANHCAIELAYANGWMKNHDQTSSTSILIWVCTFDMKKMSDCSNWKQLIIRVKYNFGRLKFSRICWSLYYNDTRYSKSYNFYDTMCSKNMDEERSQKADLSECVLMEGADVKVIAAVLFNCHWGSNTISVT